MATRREESGTAQPGTPFLDQILRGSPEEVALGCPLFLSSQICPLDGSETWGQGYAKRHLQRLRPAARSENRKNFISFDVEPAGIHYRLLPPPPAPLRTNCQMSMRCIRLVVPFLEVFARGANHVMSKLEKANSVTLACINHEHSCISCCFMVRCRD